LKRVSVKSIFHFGLDNLEREFAPTKKLFAKTPGIRRGIFFPRALTNPGHVCPTYAPSWGDDSLGFFSKQRKERYVVLGSSPNWGGDAKRRRRLKKFSEEGEAKKWRGHPRQARQKKLGT